MVVVLNRESDIDDDIRSNGENNYLGMMTLIALVMIEVIVAVKLEMLKEGILAKIVEVMCGDSGMVRDMVIVELVAVMGVIQGR